MKYQENDKVVVINIIPYLSGVIYSVVNNEFFTGDIQQYYILGEDGRKYVEYEINLIKL